jgi:hypothetical protein
MAAGIKKNHYDCVQLLKHTRMHLQKWHVADWKVQSCARPPPRIDISLSTQRIQNPQDTVSEPQRPHEGTTLPKLLQTFVGSLGRIFRTRKGGRRIQEVTDTQEAADTKEAADTQEVTNTQDGTDIQKTRRKGLRIRVTKGGTEAYFAAIWNVLPPGSPPHAPRVHHRLSGIRNKHARKRTAAFHPGLPVQVALGPRKRTAASWKQR